jgi:acyl carrier protein
MNRDELHEKLTRVFREVFGQPMLVIHDDMSAADVRNWDSLNHVTMIYAAEKKFGIKFSTREVQNLKNVGELVSLIDQKIP